MKRFWQTSLGIPLYIEERGRSLRILGRVKQRGARFYPEFEGDPLPPESTEEAAKTAVEHATTDTYHNTPSFEPKNEDPTPSAA